MDVRLWDASLSSTNKYKEMKLLKTTDKEMNKDLSFGGFIIIDGKSYSHCMYNEEENMLCVEPVELNEEAEEILDSEEFKCPYCGSVNDDAWEFSEEGEAECHSCQSYLKFEKNVIIEYNITPLKCSPVIRL